MPDPDPHQYCCRFHELYSRGTSGHGPAQARHDWLLEAEQLCAGAGRSEDEAWCMLDRAIVLATDLGRPGEAPPLYVRALERFEDLGVLRGQTIAACKLADLERVAGRPAEARAWLRRVDESKPNLDPAHAGVLANTWAAVLTLEGSRDASRQARRRAVAHYRRGDQQNEIFAVLIGLAHDELTWGRDAVAEAIVAEAESVPTTERRATDQARLLRIRATLAEHRGQLIAATRYLREVLENSPNGWDRAYARSDLGRLLLRVGRADEAEPILVEAADLLEGLNAPAGLAGVLRQLQQCATARGDTSEALRLSKRAVAEARAGGVESQLVATLLDHARCAMAVDDAETARGALNEVLAAGRQRAALLTPYVKNSAAELLMMLGDQVGARRLRL